jgi:hypothetical protein
VHDTYLYKKDVRHVELPDLVLATELSRLAEKLLNLIIARKYGVNFWKIISSELSLMGWLNKYKYGAGKPCY